MRGSRPLVSVFVAIPFVFATWFIAGETAFSGAAGAQLGTQVPTVSAPWKPVDRRFGSLPSGSFLLAIPMLGIKALEVTPSPISRFKPRPIKFGYPLIQTKGMAIGGGYLYISDTGKDGTHDEAAKIWRLDPKTGNLDLFYSGDVLVNSKWLYYLSLQNYRSAMLVVADYGVEPAPRSPGTGEGAKVFVLPIKDDGTAGEPRILHEGPPFRSPEGVTVIGDTVIVADWAAGETGSRPEAPDVKFLRGAMFRLPLAGGFPVKIFPEQKWVTLIGTCVYFDRGKMYLRMIDLDSGRIDRSDLAYLPQSGTPEFFQAEIKSTAPLVLGELERTILTEDGPVDINIPKLKQGEHVVIRTGRGARFDDDSVEKTISRKEFDLNGNVTFIVRTDMSVTSIPLAGEVRDEQGNVSSTFELTIPKDLTVAAIVMDNKHAGAMVAPELEKFEPLLHATADGTTRSVVLFSPAGGTPATLWRGSPLKQPMGIQLSENQRSIYVTDQAGGPNGHGAVWEIKLPSVAEKRLLFPNAP